ncbi:MAG TPA: hypothetical protein VGQ85_05575 [Candidatus Limnocylindrales bacterium]|nr:hypothetical protein [Candidatus Limnocylindrales bacterium]
MTSTTTTTDTLGVRLGAGGAVVLGSEDIPDEAVLTLRAASYREFGNAVYDAGFRAGLDLALSKADEVLAKAAADRPPERIKTRITHVKTMVHNAEGRIINIIEEDVEP